MIKPRFQLLTIRAFTTPSKFKQGRWFKPSLVFLSIAATSAIVSISYLINSNVITKKPTELQNEYFIPYQISRRVVNNPNYFILELTPQTPQKVNIWSQLTNRSLWSVEIKQPEIMVARNYTPLPLKFVNDETDKLTVISSKNEIDNVNDGKLIIFVKSYDTGEVSKWLTQLPLNYTVEIRGPFVEYQIQDQVDHVNFFVAGTGIVSPLQLLLNPYTNGIQGPHVNLFYSSNDLQNELGPLKNVLYNRLNDLAVKKHGLFQLWTFEDSKKQNISDIKNLKNFIKVVPPVSKLSDDNTLSLVCGPERYIETIAGKKYDFSQGPVEGILGQKGWSNKNVFKLS